MMTSEMQFDNCWADSSTELAVLTIGGCEFRMREITIGEDARIARESATSVPGSEPTEQQTILYARTIGKEPPDLTDEERAHLTQLAAQPTHGIDGSRVMILTLAASLGVWTRFGNEGWSADRDVTVATVEALKSRVLRPLWREYQKSFRDSSGDAA